MVHWQSGDGGGKYWTSIYIHFLNTKVKWRFRWFWVNVNIWFERSKLLPTGTAYAYAQFVVHTKLNVSFMMNEPWHRHGHLSVDWVRSITFNSKLQLFVSGLVFFCLFQNIQSINEWNKIWFELNVIHNKIDLNEEGPNLLN